MSERMGEKSSGEDMAVYHHLQKLYVLLDDGDRRALRQVDLTPTQFNLLQRLGQDVEKGRTISELANLLLCTRGNVTRLVQRLEGQGLVRSGGDPHDHRLVRVAMTPEGAARLETALRLHTRSVERRMGALEPATRHQLAELVRQLALALEADLAEQPS
jgi:DNA-binding MarR family transcriptional regulator